MCLLHTLNIFQIKKKLNPVNGNQQPDITWFLNDVELDQNDPRFTYTVNGCQRKIRINHPKHEESGEIKAYNPGKNMKMIITKII